MRVSPRATRQVLSSYLLERRPPPKKLILPGALSHAADSDEAAKDVELGIEDACDRRPQRRWHATQDRSRREAGALVFRGARGKDRITVLFNFRSLCRRRHRFRNCP
jgi:hypothetical protein